ncbi:hypothetical protein MAR_013536 [Mya arenaria]|uniref:Uncharacterized protein n=1 Tax=Mya arenaria TaxID=6604 RepID=A0ABY7G070_MYAAR|nr:hypothetical protein MAR_013536 [Mya arenaria]
MYHKIQTALNCVPATFSDKLVVLNVNFSLLQNCQHVSKFTTIDLYTPVFEKKRISSLYIKAFGIIVYLASVLP